MRSRDEPQSFGPDEGDEASLRGDLPLPSPVEPESRPRGKVGDRRRTAEDLTVVGVDFGTSSTKIAFRQLGERRSWLLPAAQPKREYPWFCSPTTYQVKDGRVWLGTLLTTGTSNLKLELLKQAGPPGEFGEVERRAVAYLGFILEASLPLIEAHLEVDRIEPRFNIGVPMSYLGGGGGCEALLKKYIDVARAAIATTTAAGGIGIEQAMELEDCERAVRDGIERSSEVETVWALPESMATLVSLDTDPNREPGAYTVLDIGAGTTDVSTSQVRRDKSGSVKLVCYQDSTEPYGVLALNEKIEEGAAPMEASQPLWRQWEVSWWGSMQKDSANRWAHQSWKRSTLLLAGGGARYPRVRSCFERLRDERCPVLLAFPDGEPVSIDSYAPSAQVLGSLGAKGDGREDFQMAAVAHGLTYMRREWPEMFLPEEVKVLPPDLTPYKPERPKWV